MNRRFEALTTRDCRWLSPLFSRLFAAPSTFDNISSGELVALCNYDGKLRAAKDYTVSTGESGETRVVLSRFMIAGQRILAVLKN